MRRLPVSDKPDIPTLDISVIVVNFNGEAMLDACFEGLRRQADVSVEAILVDNGSSDVIESPYQRTAQRHSSVSTLDDDRSSRRLSRMPDTSVSIRDAPKHGCRAWDCLIAFSHLDA